MSGSSSKIKKTYINGEQVEEELTSQEQLAEAIEEVTHASKTGVKEITVTVESAPVKKFF